MSELVHVDDAPFGRREFQPARHSRRSSTCQPSGPATRSHRYRRSDSRAVSGLAVRSGMPPVLAIVPNAPPSKRTLIASHRSTFRSKPSRNAAISSGRRSVSHNSSAAEWVTWRWPWPPPAISGSLYVVGWWAGHLPLEDAGVGLWVASVVLEDHRCKQRVGQLDRAERTGSDARAQDRVLVDEVIGVANAQRPFATT